MSQTDENPFSDEWIAFLAQVKMSENYRWVTPQPLASVQNPLVDQMLPGLLLLRLGALMDQGFNVVIREKALPLPRNKRNLAGRIEALNTYGQLLNYDEIERIRLKRNAIAHEANIPFSWDELEKAIETAKAEIENLDLSDPPPDFVWASSFEPVPDPINPRIMRGTLYFGLNVNGQPYVQFRTEFLRSPLREIEPPQA